MLTEESGTRFMLLLMLAPLNVLPHPSPAPSTAWPLDGPLTDPH